MLAKNFSEIEGLPAEIAVRLPGFASFGIDGNKLINAVRQAGQVATPTWSIVLINYGDAAIKDGEKASNALAAEKKFMEASFWYFLARFPHITQPAAAKAYLLHTDAYLHASRYSKFSTEVVTIPFADKKVRAILRLPKINKNKLPAVMIWGGIDVWKSDLEIHSQGNAFLDNGMAVLAIDMPGTGECPIPVSDTAHDWYLTALDFLKNDPRIDATRIGCYGLSFGGYWAVKLALMAPWLAAVVNNAGPIHYTFQPQWIAGLPRGIKMALARVCGLNPVNDSARLSEILASLSLKQQKLLPSTSHAPLLSLNGEKDELVPIRDLHFIHEQGVKQDSLIFAEDRHVASRHWHLHERFVSAWMTKRLVGLPRGIN